MEPGYIVEKVSGFMFVMILLTVSYLADAMSFLFLLVAVCEV